MSRQKVWKQRAFWLRHLHLWHWVSAALSLVAMLLFAVTGFTLNHAGDIEAKPAVSRKDARLPAPLLAQLKTAKSDKAPLPAEVSSFIAKAIGADTTDRPGEWSDDEIYVALPRPGGDAYLTIERESGAIDYELTNRGWISYLNDLHKGRNTGPVWGWFIDIFAAACVVFSLSGLVLLYLHARTRPMTWPTVAIGLLLPVLLALLFIHM
jgi:hypothetical protein